MSNNRSLSGIKVACFYPWQTRQSSGALVRFTCLFKYLVEQGADVTLAVKEAKADVSLKGLRIRSLTLAGERSHEIRQQQIYSQYCEMFGRSLTQDEAYFGSMFEPESYVGASGMLQWATSIIKENDVILVDYPMMVPFLTPIAKKLGKPIIVTFLDALHLLHGATKDGREMLLKKEIEAAKLVDKIIFVSPDDKKIFEQHGIIGDTVINTGDINSIEPFFDVDDSQTPLCLFVGSKHEPNVVAANSLKTMAQSLPNLRFVVAGTCLPAFQEANFQSMGYVTDDVLSSLYQRARLVVIPLSSGSGSSLKFYEALAYGKAVLSTSIGARGHDNIDRLALHLEDDLTQYPKLIQALINDPQGLKSLGQRARKYAEQQDFRKLFSVYGQAILSLTGKQSSGITQTKKRSLVVADPSLKDGIGHHLTYLSSLQETAKDFGIDIASLISKEADAEICSQVAGVPCFNTGIHESAGDNPYTGILAASHYYDFFKVNDYFRADLIGGMKDVVSPSDVLFLPNITERQLLGLAAALKATNLKVFPEIVLMLRYSLVRPFPQDSVDTPFIAKVDEQVASYYRMGFEALRNVIHNAPIRIVTDSEGLAEEYRIFTQMPVEVLPIPHTMSHVLHPRIIPGVPAKSAKRTRLVFMGDARAEKGFGFLPELVSALNQRIGKDSIEFVFQAYVSSHYHIEMLRKIQQLESLRLENVHLIRCAMTVEEYQTVLDSADIVLLPYDQVTYKSRTSGPFVEAVCSGKPVVIPDETWMADQFAEAQPGVIFARGTQESIVTACVDAVTRLDDLTEKAKAFSKTFRAKHNPQSFISQLMRLPLAAKVEATITDDKKGGSSNSGEVYNLSEVSIGENAYDQDWLV